MLPERIDGRRERSARTRKAIVAAVIDLIEEGNVSPTAAQIAKRAGIAVRSIRQHFPSREALFAAAAVEHARRVDPALVHVDEGLPLEQRIAAFVDARARELEMTAPVRRATSFVSSAALERAQGSTWQRRRQEVERVFEDELHPAGADLLDALELLAHARTWDTLRIAMRLSPEAAAAVMTRAIRAMLKRR